MKFQQNLRSELKKEILNKITFVDPWLDSYKEVFDNTNIDKLLDKQHNDLKGFKIERTKIRVSSFIQVYCINLFFQNSLLANEVHIFL